MKLLLDTQALLWALDAPERLMSGTRHSLADPANPVFVSVGSLSEIAVKCGIGMLGADVDEIAAQMAPASKLQWLGITPDHLHTLSQLPVHAQHCDPFDHLIVAQAIRDGMTLVTQDQNAALYPVRLMAP